jgi:hypothetical protein
MKIVPSNNIILDTSKIQYYLSQGMYHKNWYTHEKEMLLKHLPEFHNLPIIRVFAVTSMTTSIEANVCLAIKALLQIKRNEKFNGFLPNQKRYLDLVRNGFDVPGRKIMNFIKALEGDHNAVVVDIWMCRAFNVLEKRILTVNGRNRDYFKTPSKRIYDAIEEYCIIDAKRIGVEPRQYQSILWGAIKRELGMTKNVSWSDLLIKKKGIFPFIQ